LSWQVIGDEIITEEGGYEIHFQRKRDIFELESESISHKLQEWAIPAARTSLRVLLCYHG
jgi:hypothetical protein